MRSHSIVGEYELETLQIYFPCSMELQEELIRNGYKVPIETPIPIIYGNYKGYENGKSPEGVKKKKRLFILLVTVNPLKKWDGTNLGDISKFLRKGGPS